MNDLLRELAPISDAAWKAIDEQARQALVVQLAARRLVDFVGPKGWDESAMNLGRVRPLKGAMVALQFQHKAEEGRLSK